MEQWIESISTLVAAVAAIIAVIVAWWQLRLAAEDFRDKTEVERANSDAQTRPYLALDVVPGIAGNSSFDLVISNQGKTFAREIAISIEGLHFEAQSSGDELGPALGRLFEQKFELAPGARRRVFWRIPESNGSPRGDIGTPVAATILVDYVWVRDDGRSPEHYSDRLAYDLTEYPKLTPVPEVRSDEQQQRSAWRSA